MRQPIKEHLRSTFDGQDIRKRSEPRVKQELSKEEQLLSEIRTLKQQHFRSLQEAEDAKRQSEADRELCKALQNDMVMKDAEHRRAQMQLLQRVDAHKQVAKHYKSRERAAIG